MDQAAIEADAAAKALIDASAALEEFTNEQIRRSLPVMAWLTKLMRRGTASYLIVTNGMAGIVFGAMFKSVGPDCNSPAEFRLVIEEIHRGWCSKASAFRGARRAAASCAQYQGRFTVSPQNRGEATEYAEAAAERLLDAGRCMGKHLASAWGNETLNVPIVGIENIVFTALCLLARDGRELQSLVVGLHKNVIEKVGALTQ